MVLVLPAFSPRWVCEVPGENCLTRLCLCVGFDVFKRSLKECLLSFILSLYVVVVVLNVMLGKYFLVLMGPSFSVRYGGLVYIHARLAVLRGGGSKGLGHHVCGQECLHELGKYCGTSLVDIEGMLCVEQVAL